MGRATRGCGCAIAVLFLIVVAAGAAYWKFVRPWLRNQPPPPSGAELTVRVLDVGSVNGDSILITSPAGKTVLIDAGDTTKGKAVVDALKRNNIQQLDYFIATHPHPDHIGGSAEVFKAVKVLNVIDNGQKPGIPSVSSVQSVFLFCILICANLCNLWILFGFSFVPLRGLRGFGSVLLCAFVSLW